jgi:hypothetical protein
MRMEDLLEELGIECRREGHEHCRPGWIQLDCPFCSKEWFHFRLGYNIAKKYANCWACGFKRMPDVLAEATGEPVKKFLALFKEVESPKFKGQLHTGTLRLPTSVVPLKEAHKVYLRSRKFDPDILTDKWGVMGTDFDSTLPWRIFIPIVYRGEVVSWSTRRITDDNDRRYHNAAKWMEKLPRKELLYGEDFIRTRSVIAVEGFFDVWRIGEGAVATMTTSYSRAQIAKLSKYPRVTVCFDNEPTAQERADRLVSELSVFGGEYYKVVLDAKDPSASSSEEIRELKRRFLV